MVIRESGEVGRHSDPQPPRFRSPWWYSWKSWRRLMALRAIKPQRHGREPERASFGTSPSLLLPDHLSTSSTAPQCNSLCCCCRCCCLELSRVESSLSLGPFTFHLQKAHAFLLRRGPGSRAATKGGPFDSSRGTPRYSIGNTFSTSSHQGRAPRFCPFWRLLLLLDGQRPPASEKPHARPLSRNGAPIASRPKQDKPHRSIPRQYRAALVADSTPFTSG